MFPCDSPGQFSEAGTDGAGCRHRRNSSVWIQPGYNERPDNCVFVWFFFFMLIRNILPGTECVHTYTCGAGYTSVFFKIYFVKKKNIKSVIF